MKDDELKLFQQMVKEVKPLKKSNIAETKARKPKPKPNQLYRDQVETVRDMLSDNVDDAPFHLADYLEYCQPGIQKKTLKKLKQGKYPIEDRIDLHGLNVDQARQMIHHFLDHAVLQQFQTVLIIHGKGYRSKEKGPVLKPLVNSWLRQKTSVLAFCSAQLIDGGTGALYVLLKRKKPEAEK